MADDQMKTVLSELEEANVTCENLQQAINHLRTTSENTERLLGEKLRVRGRHAPLRS